MTTWVVPATVRRVRDGDTIVVDLDLGWGTWKLDAPVRLARINCPELNEDAGQLARGFTVDACPEGAKVIITSRSLDKYGRTLGEVTLPDGRNLSDALLAAGHAVPMKR